MTWMPLENLAEHQDQGCDLDMYLQGPHGGHWWDATCQIKFAPQAFLDRSTKSPPFVSFDEDDPDLPQNHDEITTFLDLVFGEHPELKTLGDIKAAWAIRRKEMR